MRKLFVLLIAVLTVFTLASCKNEPAHEHTWDAGTDNGNGKMVYECTECHETYSAYKNYSIGDTGPAGGLVFYDCDEDNETGNADGLSSSECGWRYLEAAPADLASTYVFGYCRTGEDTDNLFVNGTPTYNAADCTGTAIGTGKANTQFLVAAMGTEVYSASSGSTKTADYAAKLCDDYSAGGKSDWFLPSYDELNLMYANKSSIGGFAVFYYWSSSEYNSDSQAAGGLYFGDGYQSYYYRKQNYNVRPVRAF